VNLNFFDSEVLIKVSDYGIGIPESERSNLFQPFFRAENVGDTPGTGLGLSIAKKFVDLLGGEIDVVSALNKGAVFTIRLSYN
jgi:signal transduction histidine kinase